MDLIDLVRWSQVLGLVLMTVVCVAFLVHYSRRWDLSNQASRFIVTLNLALIFAALAFTVGRIWSGYIIIEAFRAVVLLGLAILMAMQFMLMMQQDD